MSNVTHFVLNLISKSQKIYQNMLSHECLTNTPRIYNFLRYSTPEAHGIYYFNRFLSIKRIKVYNKCK